jgi:hypothetical protein
MGHDYGRFVWFELVTSDIEAAKKHYPEVLSWKLMPMEMAGGSYTALVAGEQPVGGIVSAPKGVPPHWTSYVSVADVDKSAKKVVTAGGKVLAPAFDVPGVGRMQAVADNQGAAFHLFHSEKEDAPAAKGSGAFHWNELLVKDTKAALSFYADVLGYTSDAMEMPTGTYHVLKQGESMRGGLMQAPMKDMPNVWLQYVTVDDCDATVERAKRHGCTPLGDAMDVPGVGRFATLEDAQGAVFAVIKPAAG